MLVWLTCSAEVATFQEKRGKRYQALDIWRTAGEWKGQPDWYGRGYCKLRTIVERENMLPRCPRRAQQQIRLHEVARIQW